MDFACEPLSEDSLLLRFGDRIDAAINARVHAAARAMRAARLPGVIDIAPAYATLLVRFDPLAQDHDTVSEAIVQALGDLPRQRPALQAIDYADAHHGSLAAQSGARRDGEREATASEHAAVRVVEIPVCYGGEYGLDLDAVAEHARLSREDVIARHAAPEYAVAMLGFAPGFPYLLGLDPALHVPRRATPRTRVPAGSVAIGGAQTGIYPRELPGGWHLVGRTPRILFDAQRDPPCLLAPGDRVRFRAIDAAEFARLAGTAA